MNAFRTIGVSTLAAGLFVAMSAAPVHAKDACVQDGSGVLYVFK